MRADRQIAQELATALIQQCSAFAAEAMDRKAVITAGFIIAINKIGDEIDPEISHAIVETIR